VRTKPLLILLAHAFAGWFLCAVAMVVAMGLTTLDNALVIHAIAAPVVFATLSVVYFRIFRFTPPFQTAASFVLFVIAMDVLVVGLAVQRSLAMFTSALGTWIPFALIFLSTYLTGRLVSAATVGSSRPRPAPSQPGRRR
jgi:hypothetical protein